MTNTAAPCGDEKCIHEDTCELSGGDHCRWTTEDDMTTIPVKTYTERQVLDMLRILAWMIRCDNCLLNEKCEVEDICQCKKSLIDYAKNNPIKEAGEMQMSKAKGRYYDEFRGLRIDDSSVNSDYITELENKAKMFDNLVSALDHVYMNESGNYACEDMENILERAKKI